MKHSIFVRFMLMGAVLLGLGVPLVYVNMLVWERTSRRDEAVREIGSAWGGPQAVYGPILVVPYRCPDDIKAVNCTGRIVVQAKKVTIDGSLNPEVRRRSLFEAVVYGSRMSINATFAPDLADQHLTGDRILWQDTALVLGISDPRGIAGALEARSGDHVVRFVPGGHDAFITGVHAMVGTIPAASNGERSYSIDLTLNGTRELAFAAVGDDATITLASPWPHASFMGSTLPISRTTGSSGFTATWTTGEFRRPIPAVMSVPYNEKPAALIESLADSKFGVSLATPVDVYQQTDRAVKYAMLFILFTFTTTFLWEITRKLFVHPIQYLFIGFALCIFYLLLLSVAEHAGFDRAYALATAAIVGLLAWYWRWVAGTWRQGIGMGGAMATLYGFLFLLLRLEDHALLAGSVALFLALVIVMALTKRVDWANASAQQVQKS